MSHTHDHAHHADGHHHEHDHGHAHDHAHGGLGGHHHHGSGQVLLFSLCFTLVFAVIELIGGWVSGSLALMSDAGHMFTDSTSLAIGAGAAWLARRPASRAHSYGLQRAEVLGALFNAVLMIVVVVMIAASAVQRLFEPEPVAGATVLVIAALGLCVNLVIGFILLRGEQTLNVRGALLHVMGDLAGSVAALAAGLVILLTGWVPIDALLSLFVSGLIALSAVPLMRDVIRVLMEGVPKDVDTDDVHEALVAVGGVQAVHDLHVWTLSSHQRALSAHVEIARLDDWDEVLPHLQTVLAERFSISHSTLQPESRDTARACRLDPCCEMRTA